MSAHLFRDEPALDFIQALGKIPGLADEEGHLQTEMPPHLGQLRAQQAAADDDGPLAAAAFAPGCVRNRRGST